MPDRYFTLQEVQEDLLPWLRQVFDAIEPLKHDLAEAKVRVQTLMNRMHSNGGADSEEKLEEATRTLHEAQDSINKHAYSIVERGIILRSVEQGLVDFPSMRDGRPVHLCWLANEPDITHWHEMDEGFASRQPL